MVDRYPYVCIEKMVIPELIGSMQNLLPGLHRGGINPILEVFLIPAVLLRTLLLGFFVPPALVMMGGGLQLWRV